MAFWWFKLEFCQPSLLPSKKSIYKNFPYEVKVYQNLVLFAFCIFCIFWARTGWSTIFWTEPRRPHRKVVRFHICGYTHCQFHFGCMTRNCKKKTQKTWMLKKLLSVTWINKCIFEAHNIKSGRISFLLLKFRRTWCRPFLGLGFKKCTYWFM